MPAHNPDAGDGTAAAGAGDRHVSLERLTCDRRWVAWRDELRGASDAPVRSIYGATDRAAKSDDPATWVPHDVAWAVRANIDDAGAGIGVMLGCVNGVWLAAVDLISCRNSLTGQFTSRATNLMQRLQTYIEIAPSGNDVTALLLIDPADAPALRVLLEAHPGTPFKQGDGALEQPAAIELHIEDHCLPVTWQALDDTAELRRVPFADLRWLIEQAGATSQGEMADTDAASKADSAADLTGHTPTELALTVSLFKTRHTAYGVMQQMTWRAFTDLFRRRRQGDKTGKNFVLAEFQREPNGRVHRIGANLMARTAIGLDIETSKKTDEIPPPFEDAVERIKARGWAAIVYTSHNHTPALPRFRIVLPISSEIDFKLPVVEVIAKHLDLSGVLDTGKVGAASVFYFPSAEPGQLAHHQTEIISGKPIAAEWITECAAAILAAREAEQKRQRARDLEAATKRREDRIARGLDPDHSIIEAIRDRLDLADELIRHGYLPVPGRHDLFLYPASQTRVPGVHILTGHDGVERVFSHHSGDPLAPGNLPVWCSVRAIDAVDVKIILDFGGDRTAALRSLAQKFGIQTRRRSAPPPSGPNGSDHDDDAHDGAQSRVADDGDTADEPCPPPSDETEAGGEEPVASGDTQQRDNDDIGSTGASESEYARILKIITSATPRTVVGALISALLQSDLTPTDEVRLIQITSVASADGESRATISAIKHQLKLARDRLARDRANAEREAQQRAEQDARLQRQQKPGSAYDRILAAIQAAKPEAAVQVLINLLLRSDVTPSEQDLLIRATKLRSGAGIRAIQDQLQQARDAQRKAQQQQRGRGVAPPPDPIAEVIAEFNGRYFVANEGGRAMIWEPTRDPMLDNRIYYHRSKPRDLRTFYMNRIVQVGEKKNGKPILRNPADIWLTDPDRRQYIHGIAFDPSGKERPGIYNLWQNFAFAPKEGSWQKMQDHLRTVMCASNEKHYRYLRKWLARMVQFPAQQGEVAIVLRGLEGTGKSVLGDAMRRIFGQHGFAISNPVHLVGKFNAHLRDCIVLFADEAFFPNDGHHVGVLKALITQPYLTIEAKGENIVLSPNFVHLIMASNAGWVVPASLEARRFFILDVLATHIGDRPYFKALWNELENGGLEATARQQSWPVSDSKDGRFGRLQSGHSPVVGGPNRAARISVVSGRCVCAGSVGSSISKRGPTCPDAPPPTSR